MKKSIKNIILLAVSIVLFKLSFMRYQTNEKEGALAGVLTGFCTIYAYSQMNREQKQDEDDDTDDNGEWKIKE